MTFLNKGRRKGFFFFPEGQNMTQIQPSIIHPHSHQLWVHTNAGVRRLCGASVEIEGGENGLWLVRERAAACSEINEPCIF